MVILRWEPAGHTLIFKKTLNGITRHGHKSQEGPRFIDDLKSQESHWNGSPWVWELEIDGQMLRSENLPSYSIHANTDEETFSCVPLLPTKHGKDIPRNTLLPALRASFNSVTLRSPISHRSSHPRDAWECLVTYLTVTTGRMEMVAIVISTCPIYQ